MKMRLHDHVCTWQCSDSKKEEGLIDKKCTLALPVISGNVYIFIYISQVGTIRNVLIRLAGMREHSLKGTSEDLLEELEICGREFVAVDLYFARSGRRDAGTWQAYIHMYIYIHVYI